MDHDKSETKGMNRRGALRVLGVGLGAATGALTLLEACKSNSSAPAAGPAAAAPAAGGACQDRVETDDNAKNLRKVLQYKEKSDNPEKKCTLCAQYEAGKYGDCGGCKLFAGAVNPEGACLSFAPKGAAAPGAAPAAPAKAG